MTNDVRSIHFQIIEVAKYGSARTCTFYSALIKRHFAVITATSLSLSIKSTSTPIFLKILRERSLFVFCLKKSLRERTGMSTLVPPPPMLFNPRDDAMSLYRAFKGFGCDTPTVINILSHRDAIQRALIQQEYRNLKGEELTKRLSSELKECCSALAI